MFVLKSQTFRLPTQYKWHMAISLVTTVEDDLHTEKPGEHNARETTWRQPLAWNCYVHVGDLSHFQERRYLYLFCGPRSTQRTFKWQRAHDEHGQKGNRVSGNVKGCYHRKFWSNQGRCDRFIQPQTPQWNKKDDQSSTGQSESFLEHDNWRKSRCGRVRKPLHPKKVMRLYRHRHGRKITTAMLDTQRFLPFLATIVKRETRMALDAQPKRESRKCKAVEAAYSTGAQSTSPKVPISEKYLRWKQNRRCTPRCQNSEQPRYQPGLKWSLVSSRGHTTESRKWTRYTQL